MAAETARTTRRSPGPSEVFVNKLSGGPPLRGSLVHLGRDGACVMLDRPMDSGEVIRLTFPQAAGGNRPHGRMIIGHVLRTQGRPGRHLIGVTFGWSTGFDRNRQAAPTRAGLWPRLRDYLKKLARRRPCG